MTLQVSALAFLAAVLCAHPALAQAGPERTIHGSVTDGNEPLKGAVVMLENESTKAVVTYLSTADGHYRFLHLDSHIDYVIYATYRGHESKHHEISKFDSHLQIELALPIKLD